MDRGEDHAVTAVVGQGQGPAEVAAHVAERVVPHDRQVAQRAGRLGPEGRDLLPLSSSEMDQVRAREIGMVFQEPMTSLNPIYRVGDQIGEAVRTHRRVSKREALATAVEMLKLVQIPNAERRVHD